MEQNFFKISDSIKECDKKALELCKQKFNEIGKITEYNQVKMLSAFIKNGVSEAHFSGSTGYGYGDRGRDTLDRVFADAVGAESAIIRHNFVCGTHALTVALFGMLRPNDTMLCVTGRPYDTLVGVIGIDKVTDGSLREYGINYEQVDLVDGEVDIDAIVERLKTKFYKMAYIQRSCGYAVRRPLGTDDIEKIAKAVKSVSPDTIVMVDNCYGEFVETREPTECGADIMAGSLIKNPGGAIAPTGGYIAGKATLVEQCANRLTVPGIGSEVGATLGTNRELYMGLFSAPHVVGEALKTAVYAAALLEIMGYETYPKFNEKRADIIQTVTLGDPQKVIDFCKGMQSGAPVDSYVVPEPWAMPGYDCDVIMAAGAFTLGASIELSCDAPLREPYAVWMQGGINFHSAKMGILLAVDSMNK
ncbi:MAG: methionine gamma-lyase family protein [Clostridia bacterium]|nr:methionine gamma-lyase family protein [Clostridia bacterium]